MQSFALVKVAVLLAALQGVSALPTKDTPKSNSDTEVTTRETEFWFPGQWNYPAVPANGPITANGANGGTNYGGDGANGGSIDINRFTGGAAVNANGANGGQNTYGNGANGGSISVGKRDEAFFYPGFYRPTYVPAANGPISATGANGGYNYGGNGANFGGAISINRREDEAGEFLFPHRPWYQPPAVPVNGAVNANGANGGYNYGGDGANGGSISINRREEEAGEFLFPYRPWYQPAVVPVTGAVNANGANGGTNYYGNGANGGAISINRREEEAGDFLFPYRPWYQAPSPPVNGAISANGANGGYNYGGDGANGGAISVGRY